MAVVVEQPARDVAASLDAEAHGCRRYRRLQQLPADRLQAHDPDRCDTLTTHGRSAHVTFGFAPNA